MVTLAVANAHLLLNAHFGSLTEMKHWSLAFKESRIDQDCAASSSKHSPSESDGSRLWFKGALYMICRLTAKSKYLKLTVETQDSTMTDLIFTPVGRLAVYRGMVCVFCERLICIELLNRGMRMRYVNSAEPYARYILWPAVSRAADPPTIVGLTQGKVCRFGEWKYGALKEISSTPRSGPENFSCSLANCDDYIYFVAGKEQCVERWSPDLSLSETFELPANAILFVDEQGRLWLRCKGCLYEPRTELDRVAPV